MEQGPQLTPTRTPLYEAEHAERYRRQELIKAYEASFSCRLVVVVDVIFPDAITLFEELICEANPQQDLYVLLWSPGGDGETAIRLIRSAQQRCRELTVVVPDIAKSAATIFALGANHIVMGPTSDLGPIDAQFRAPGGFGGLVSAKEIIAAYNRAHAAVEQAPQSYPLHASLLSDVTALMVEQAQSAIDRTDEVLREALRANADRSDDQVNELYEALIGPLAKDPKIHSSPFGAADARRCKLPVLELDHRSDQWRQIWTLWTRYFMLHGIGQAVYEGSTASRLLSYQ